MEIKIGDIYKYSGDKKHKPVVFRIKAILPSKDEFLGYVYDILNHPDKDDKYRETISDIYWIVTLPNQLDKITMEKLVDTLDKISEKEALAWCI